MLQNPLFVDSWYSSSEAMAILVGAWILFAFADLIANEKDMGDPAFHVAQCLLGSLGWCLASPILRTQPIQRLSCQRGYRVQ